MPSMVISTTSPTWSGGGVSAPVRPHDSASEPDAQVPEASTSPALTHEARERVRDELLEGPAHVAGAVAADLHAVDADTVIARSRKPSASR